MLHPKLTLNCGGTIVDFHEPKIMGILNVTPDSFFDGGRYQDSFLSQVEKMLNEGATFIDVGGMSSRPGAEIISTDEELSRVIPVIEAIKKHFPNTLISLDTIRAKVAKAGCEAGAVLINDISAGLIDEQLLPTVAELDVPYILMHMQGNPSNMQDQPLYDNIIIEITDFFIKRLEYLRALNIKDIILDVGFGFGKSIAHNYQLLNHMSDFQLFDLPILAGISRKSMVCKALNVNPKDALNGTTALHMVALDQGAKILRVHDVKEAKECIVLWGMLKNTLY